MLNIKKRTTDNYSEAYNQQIPMDRSWGIDPCDCARYRDSLGSKRGKRQARRTEDSVEVSFWFGDTVGPSNNMGLIVPRHITTELMMY